MGQKISPVGLRLGITHNYQSQWFVDPRNGSMKKNYPSLILEDLFIREFITPKFPRTSIAKILIFRTLDYIRVEIYTAPTQNLSLLSSNKPVNATHKNEKENTGEKQVRDTKSENLVTNESSKQKTNSTNDNSLNGLNLKTLQEDLQLALTKYKKNTLSLLFSNPKNIKN